MKIALLGYGKEGKATEKYFKSHYQDLDCDIFENFTSNDIKKKDFSSYDLVFRSPSVPPLNLKNETSITKYFFDHCPCPIIGVTGTKGKGTTCSFIKAILDSLRKEAYLVGNIGVPAIEVLDNLKPNSIVVYELSSFQLWDLHKSPHIAVVLRIEPDHLNVHKDFADYVDAKSHIAKYQTPEDTIIYFKNNPDSLQIATKSPAKHRFSYPNDHSSLKFTELLGSLKVPGDHNKENAEAALLAVSAYLNIPLEELIETHFTTIKSALENFRGLPHRLEFLRNLNNVKYYDDNFSTNPSSTRVAVNAFPGDRLVIIIGGRDKTNNKDLSEIYEILKSPQIKKIILLGESGHEIANRYHDNRFINATSLEEAVNFAKSEAEKIAPAIVLMSPAAASFDMFENVYVRGDQFKSLVSSLTPQ